MGNFSKAWGGDVEESVHSVRGNNNFLKKQINNNKKNKPRAYKLAQWVKTLTSLTTLIQAQKPTWHKERPKYHKLLLFLLYMGTIEHIQENISEYF